MRNYEREFQSNTALQHEYFRTMDCMKKHAKLSGDYKMVKFFCEIDEKVSHYINIWR